VVRRATIASGLRILPLVVLLACGGAPSAKKKPSALAGAIAAATSGRVPPGTAVVTFAAFLAGEAPDDPQAPGGVPLNLVTAPVDASLPIDLPALRAASPDHAAAIGAARDVVFVRYAGPPLPALAHVRAASEAAVALGGVLVDLGTRRAYAPDELTAFLQSEGWAAEQIVVEAQKEASGQVMFTTYGMARLGLPDLELSGVDPAQARLGFGAFQKVLHALQARERAVPGDEVGGVALRECARPPEAYEQACVRM